LSKRREWFTRRWQGDNPFAKYYDEVEKKLTLLTTKTLMSHDTASATVLSEKYRNDARHTFISGLNNSLKMAVFPAKPEDLHTALALAQEAQSSIERSVFAATLARHADEKLAKPPNKNNNWRQNQNFKPQNFNHETLATGSEIFRKKIRVNRFRNQWKLILPHGPGRRQIPIKDIGVTPQVTDKK